MHLTTGDAGRNNHRNTLVQCIRHAQGHLAAYIARAHRLNHQPLRTCSNRGVDKRARRASIRGNNIHLNTRERVRKNRIRASWLFRTIGRKRQIIRRMPLHRAPGRNHRMIKHNETANIARGIIRSNHNRIK